MQNGILIMAVSLGLVNEICTFFKRKSFLPFIKSDINRAIAHLLIAFLVIGFKGAFGFFAMIIFVVLSFIYYITNIVKNWNPSKDAENLENEDKMF